MLIITCNSYQRLPPEAKLGWYRSNNVESGKVTKKRAARLAWECHQGWRSWRGGSYSPLPTSKVFGECCKHLQWVRGRAQDSQQFFCILRCPGGLFCYVVKVGSSVCDSESYPVSLKPVKPKRMLFVTLGLCGIWQDWRENLRYIILE